VTEQPGPDAPSDRALLDRHAAGDPYAFGELFRRHRDRLWAVALRTLGNREDAADAVQDAFVSALRASTATPDAPGRHPAAAFRGDAAVTTWLHRIVVNACLDRLRRQSVRPADPLPDVEPTDARPDAFGVADTALDVTAALATLPVEQRTALVLVDMYGWSVEDTAEVLDCAPGTVKSRCARGRARLLPLLRPPDAPAPVGNQVRPGRVPPPTSPAHDDSSAPRAAGAQAAAGHGAALGPGEEGGEPR
jgi:RNA polymerase sigma-70 factor, ECF subfamily